MLGNTLSYHVYLFPASLCGGATALVRPLWAALTLVLTGLGARVRQLGSRRPRSVL